MSGKPVKRPVKRMEMHEFDEREWGRTYEQLLAEMRESIEDRLWFSDHLESLRREYLNTWIAVKSKKIIMADVDHDRLIARLTASPEGRSRAKILFVEPRGTVHIY